MKLRIRHAKKTKVLALDDGAALAVGGLKRVIEENIFGEWGFSHDEKFDISLDGKTSVGEDDADLKDVGIVSGDLLKILFCSDVTPRPSINVDLSPGTSSQNPGAAAPSSAGSASMTSVCEDELGTSSLEGFEEIQCFSPGPVFFRNCDETSEVPHLVQKIYEDDCIQNEFQALCIVLHFMMCESGFYIEGMNEHSDILPLLQPRIFAVEYCHPAGPNLKVNFSCNQLGSFILVNSVVQPCRVTGEQVITLHVVTKDYITQNFNATNKNSNAAAVYKNLSKLNRQVKETIAHPALNNMRDELQLPPVVGILSLFPEILQFIFSHLDCKSLVALSQVSKVLKEITSDDNLWRNLFIKDFKSHPVNVGTSWKAMYTKRYVQVKERRRELERYRDYEPEFRLPFGGPQYPGLGPGYPVPFPEQPFGIIGGEHDLNPQFPYGPFATPPTRFPPVHPGRPSNPDNPLPGSRYDPMYPGSFHPGRGSGMMDPDFDDFGGPSLPFSNSLGRRPNQGFRFL